MKENVKATIGSALVGAFKGALVLVIVFALSWVAINRRTTDVVERDSESSDIADCMTAEHGPIEEGEKEDDRNEAQGTMSDQEAAHTAAESGDLSKVRFLILEQGVHVDAEDNYALTLLQVASRHGHLEIVKFLIDNGAAVNAVGIDNRAALHFAIIRGHASIVRYLLENGADVNLRKRLGLTPLHVVVQSFHTDLVHILLDHGADIEAPDDRGDTPLDWAITFGSGAMVQELLERGAILRSRDAEGKTPMERAIKGWDVLKVDVLAKNGQHFPTNPRDMQRVMLLYALKQGQTKEGRAEESSGA